MSGEANKKLKKLICAGIVTLVLASTSFGGAIVKWPEDANTPPEGNFIAISAGTDFSSALRDDGKIFCWGYDYAGRLDAPDGNDYIDIDSSRSHSLALKSDGSLVAWGSNYYGQCDVPYGNDYVAISAGSGHSLALKSDGSLVAWGSNAYGRCDVPAGNDYIAIASSSHNLALRSNGTLTAWGGGNVYGELDVPEGNDFVYISCGSSHSLAIKSDKKLVAWGNNDYGQCDVPDGNYIMVDIGFLRNLTLKEDGSLGGWGWNAYCGVPGGSCELDVPEGTGFVAISASSSPFACPYNDWHSLALTSDETKTLTITSEPNNMTNIIPPIGQHTYYPGQRISISAARSPKCPDVYNFSHWEGDVADPNLAFQYLNMDTDKSVKAFFVADERKCGDECHPILQGDINKDCYINFEDFALYADMWLSCTHPDCD